MSNDKKPLFNKTVLLEKFPGKGGWTYAKLPGVSIVKTNPFGWRKVSGLIDSYELKDYKLLPLGNGDLFLPVKAEIRKLIKKEAGDKVKVILYDEEIIHAVCLDDFMICLKEEPKALKKFKSLSKEEQNELTKWIYEAKTEDDKVERIGKVIYDILR